MITRPQHERIWRIFRLISDGGFPNCTDFSRELETSRRSVLRDLDYLRDRLGMPIEFDPKRRGYFLTRPVEQIPVLEVSVADLLALVISEQFLVAQVSPGAAGRLRESFGRIYALLGTPLKLSGVELNRLLRTKQPGSVAIDFDLLDQLGRALAENRELRFAYSGGRGDLGTRRVLGQSLTISGGQWYLLAYDLHREERRIFALTRISRVKVGERAEAAPDAAWTDEHFAESFGIAHESRPVVKVVVRFSPSRAGRVAERNWHASQRIRWQTDGSCELSLKVSPTEELRAWLLSWGREAEVLAPEELRAEVAAELAVAAKNYR